MSQTEQDKPSVRHGRSEAAALIWNWQEQDAPNLPDLAATRRRHGLLQAVVGGSIGLLMFLFWHQFMAFVVWSISGLMLLAALLSPLGVYARVEKFGGWLGHVVGQILGVILLVPLFFGFFWIFGLFFRRGHRDALRRHSDPAASSYWRLRQDKDRTLSYYEHPF